MCTTCLPSAFFPKNAFATSTATPYRFELMLTRLVPQLFVCGSLVSPSFVSTGQRYISPLLSA